MFRKRFLTASLAAAVLVAPQGAATPAHAAGDVAVIAGTGTPGASGDGGPAAQAALRNPGGVAVAPDGTVYVSDSGNHTVRAIAPDGTITTVAGTGKGGTRGADLPADASGTDVDLILPQSLAIGADRTLYIADVGLGRVLALSPQGKLSVFADIGAPGSGDETRQPNELSVVRPAGLAAAPDGTVYISDSTNMVVRAVTPGGRVTTVAGNGGEQVTAAGGVATDLPVGEVQSLAVDDDGALWIAGGQLLRRVSDGRLATVTMPGEPTDGRWTRWGLSEDAGWPPADTPLNTVGAVAAGAGGVYAVDQGDGRLLRLGPGDDLTVEVELRPGVTGAAYGPIAVAASGTAYLADVSDHRLYSMSVSTAGADDPNPGGPGADGRDDSTPWWPFAAAAGVVVVLLGAWLAIRRARRAQ